MTALRRLELICGVAAGAFGWLLLVVFLLAPLGTYAGERCDDAGACVLYSGRESFLQSEGLPGILPALLIFGVIFGGIALGAYLHSRHGSFAGRALLVMCSLLLAVCTGLAVVSSDVFLLPCLALALVSSALSFVGRARAARAE